MMAIILQGQKKKYTVPNPFTKAKAIAPNSKGKTLAKPLERDFNNYSLPKGVDFKLNLK